MKSPTDNIILKWDNVHHDINHMYELWIKNTSESDTFFAVNMWSNLSSCRESPEKNLRLHYIEVFGTIFILQHEHLAPMWFCCSFAAGFSMIQMQNWGQCILLLSMPWRDTLMNCCQSWHHYRFVALLHRSLLLCSDEGLDARNISQHPLYGIQLIHINLNTSIHCSFYRYADADQD